MQPFFQLYWEIIYVKWTAFISRKIPQVLTVIYIHETTTTIKIQNISITIHWVFKDHFVFYKLLHLLFTYYFCRPIYYSKMYCGYFPKLTNIDSTFSLIATKSLLYMYHNLFIHVPINGFIQNVCFYMLFLPL